MTSHARPRGLVPALLGAIAVAVLVAPSAAPSAATPGSGRDVAPVAVPATGVTLAGAQHRAVRVPHGRRIAIAGRVEPGLGGRTVVLRRALLGRPYRDVARTRTRADGSYRFRVVARHTAVYRARVVSAASASAAGAPVSERRRVTVVARVRAGVTRHLRAGERARVGGRLRPALRGRVVRLQLRRRGRWATVARTRTRRGGRFRLRWTPPASGRYRLRARYGGSALAAAAGDRLARVHVYRGSEASWYGPGLYGNPVACGGTLAPWTLGVAHKYLPCGTRVTFRYRGRSVTVPVIDRGPFAGAREWDLTAATKARLGFSDVGTVWAAY